MGEKDNEIKKANKNMTVPTWAIWAIPSFVVVVWLFNLLAAVIVSSVKVKDYGQFGDLFGVSNSLIAGLALVLVALGVHFQKQELEKTKELLEEQSKITAAQEAALKKQNEATERQMFENVFFQMNNNFNNFISELDLKSNKDNYTKARDVLRQFHNRSAYLIDTVNNFNDKDSFERQFFEFYEEFLGPFKAKKSSGKNVNVGGGEELLPYFRSIFVILNYIHEYPSDKLDKALYIRIFRSQFSEAELTLVTLNALSEYGKKDSNEVLKTLLEKTHFLEHIRNKQFKENLVKFDLIKEDAFCKESKTSKTNKNPL